MPFAGARLDESPFTENPRSHNLDFQCFSSASPAIDDQSWTEDPHPIPNPIFCLQFAAGGTWGFEVLA